MSTQAETPKNQTQSPETKLPTLVTEEAIAERAYAFFIANGSQEGRDVEDWLQAERELQEEVNNITEDPLDAQAAS